jgi:hypothetical protein
MPSWDEAWQQYLDERERAEEARQNIRLAEYEACKVMTLQLAEEIDERMKELT